MPSNYTYKIFGASFNSKSLLYLLSTQLVFALPPNSIVSAVCGILAGVLYRNNILGSRTWRIPKWVQRLGKTYLSPLLESRMPRRSARTTLDDIDPPASSIRPVPGTTAAQAGATARQGAIAEVVQTLWVTDGISLAIQADIHRLSQRLHTDGNSTFCGSRRSTSSYVSRSFDRTDQFCASTWRKRCESICRIPAVRSLCKR